MGYDAELLATSGLDIISPFFDFNAFTAVDPNSRFAVTEHNITTSLLTRNEVAYSLFDFGVGNISGDIIDEFEIVHDGGAIGGDMLGWAITTLQGDWQNNKAGDLLGVFLDRPSGLTRIFIVESDGGSISISTIYNLVQGQRYFARVIRDISIGANGTLFLELYPTAARITPTVTLSIVLASLNSYRYRYAVMSDNASLPQSISSKISNMEAIL